jgi:hypothetical protein
VLTLVNAMHITASVLINDDESGLRHDYRVWLERLAPNAPIDQTGPDRTPVLNAGTGACCGQAGPTRTPWHFLLGQV